MDDERHALLIEAEERIRIRHERRQMVSPDLLLSTGIDEIVDQLILMRAELQILRGMITEMTEGEVSAPP